MKFAQLYFDEKNLETYYYNFTDNSVYKIKANKANSNVITISTVVSIILFNVFNVSDINILSSFSGFYYVFMAIVLGFICSLPFTFLINILSKKYFKPEYKIEMDLNQITSLFNLNKNFRKKYIRAVIILFLFTLSSSLLAAFMMTDLILFIVNVVLFICIFIMVSSYKPILMNKLKKMTEVIK